MDDLHVRKCSSVIQLDNTQDDASLIPSQNGDSMAGVEDGACDQSAKIAKKRGRRPGLYMNEQRRRNAVESAWRVLQAAHMVGPHRSMDPFNNSNNTFAGFGPTSESSAGRKARGRPRGSFKSKATRRRAIEAAVRTLRVAGLADNILEESSMAVQSTGAKEQYSNSPENAEKRLGGSSSRRSMVPNSSNASINRLFEKQRQSSVLKKHHKQLDHDMGSSPKSLNIKIRLRIKPPLSLDGFGSSAFLGSPRRMTNTIGTNSNILQTDGSNVLPYIEAAASNKGSGYAGVDCHDMKRYPKRNLRYQRALQKTDRSATACHFSFKSRSSNGGAKTIDQRGHPLTQKKGLLLNRDYLQTLNIEDKPSESDSHTSSADRIHINFEMGKEIEQNVKSQLQRRNGNAAYEKAELLVAIIENMVRSYRSSERPQRMALDAFVAMRTRPLAELLARLQNLYMPYEFVQIASGVLKMAGVDIQEGRVSWPRTVIEVAYADGVEIARLSWPSTMEDLEAGMLRSDRVWASIFPQIHLTDMPPSCVILQCVCSSIGIELDGDKLCGHKSSVMNTCRVHLDWKSVISTMNLASQVAPDSASKVLFSVS